MLSRNVGNQLPTYAAQYPRKTEGLNYATVEAWNLLLCLLYLKTLFSCTGQIVLDGKMMRTDYEMMWTRSWLQNLPGQITSIRWRQYSATYITWATVPALLLLERWTVATSELRAQHSISAPPKIPSHIFIPLKPNMPTFFALFLTSHYRNQINSPLRFHISHARPQAAALKSFASLRDVPEYSTRTSDDDVVSNGNAHDTNIFIFTDTCPHTYK